MINDFPKNFIITPVVFNLIFQSTQDSKEVWDNEEVMQKAEQTRDCSNPGKFIFLIILDIGVPHRILLKKMVVFL